MHKRTKKSKHRQKNRKLMSILSDSDRNDIVLLISSFFSVLLAWVPIRVQFGVVRGVLERLGVVRNGLGVLWGV